LTQEDGQRLLALTAAIWHTEPAAQTKSLLDKMRHWDV